MNFQFIESTRGGKVLLESGFQYCLKRTNKSSQVWRCRYRPKCSGSITVSSDDSSTIIQKSEHQCEPNIARNDVDIAVSNSKKRCREENTPVRSIFEEEMTKMANLDLINFMTEVPSFTNKKDALYRVRRISTLGVSKFKHKKDIILPEVEILKKSKKTEKILNDPQEINDLQEENYQVHKEISKMNELADKQTKKGNKKSNIALKKANNEIAENIKSLNTKVEKLCQEKNQLFDENKHLKDEINNFYTRVFNSVQKYEREIILRNLRECISQLKLNPNPNKLKIKLNEMEKNVQVLEQSFNLLQQENQNYIEANNLLKEKNNLLEKFYNRISKRKRIINRENTENKKTEEIQNDIKQQERKGSKRKRNLSDTFEKL